MDPNTFWGTVRTDIFIQVPGGSSRTFWEGLWIPRESIEQHRSVRVCNHVQDSFLWSPESCAEVEVLWALGRGDATATWRKTCFGQKLLSPTKVRKVVRYSLTMFNCLTLLSERLFHVVQLNVLISWKTQRTKVAKSSKAWRILANTRGFLWRFYCVVCSRQEDSWQKINRKSPCEDPWKHHVPCTPGKGCYTLESQTYCSVTVVKIRPFGFGGSGLMAPHVLQHGSPL